MTTKFFSILFLLFVVVFGGIFFVFSPRMIFAAETGGGQSANQVTGNKQEIKDEKISVQFFNLVQEQGMLFFEGVDAYGSFVVIALFIILLIFFVASLTRL